MLISRDISITNVFHERMNQPVQHDGSPVDFKETDRQVRAEAYISGIGRHLDGLRGHDSQGQPR